MMFSTGPADDAEAVRLVTEFAEKLFVEQRERIVENVYGGCCCCLLDVFCCCF
jgi:hypothetical protein